MISLGWAPRAKAEVTTAQHGTIIQERVKGKLISFSNIVKKQGKVQGGTLAEDVTTQGIPLLKGTQVEFDFQGNLIAFTVLKVVSVDGYWLSAQDPVNGRKGTNATLYPNGKLKRGVLANNPKTDDGTTTINKHILAPGSTVDLTEEGLPVTINAKAKSIINGNYRLGAETFLWCDNQGYCPEANVWAKKSPTQVVKTG